MKVTLIRGLPGSGKSTKAHELSDGSLHLEADMYFIRDGKYIWEKGGKNHDWCRAAFGHALANGMDVVVSNTFTQVDEMRPYLDLARHYGATVRVIAMKGDYGNVHNVPEETIRAMRSRWEDYPGEEDVEDGSVTSGAAAFIPPSAPAAAPTEADLRPTSDDPLIKGILDSPRVKVRDLGGGMFSCNFDRKTFWKGEWDASTIKARGLFIRDGKVFARSFDKFFRVNERLESSAETMWKKIQTAKSFDVFHKQNGYLAIATWDERNNRLFVASKSTDKGPYAALARQIIGNDEMFFALVRTNAGSSFAFEIIDSERDPHFVDYRERAFRHVHRADLLAWFKNDIRDGGRDVGYRCQQWSNVIDEDRSYADFQCSLSLMVNGNGSARCMNEGYVVAVRQADGTVDRFKVKTAQYCFWKHVRGELAKSAAAARAGDYYGGSMKPYIPYYDGNPVEFVEKQRWMDVAVDKVNSLTWDDIEKFKTPDMFGNPRLNMVLLQEYVV